MTFRSLMCIGAAALVAAAACSNDDDLTSVQPGTVFVAARDSFFLPDTIAVEVGKRVRWTNEGMTYHTVSSDDTLFASSVLSPSFWFEVRFDSAGTYAYHCSLHTGMIGVVVAQ
jgi:plastocyanin